MRTEILGRPAFHFVLIAILGLLIYSNTFDVPFQFDDQEYIVDNPAMRDFGYFIDTSRIDGYKTLGVERYLKTRYMAYLSFWANYRVGGMDVTGYHVVNVAVHIMNGLLVYLIVALTFKTPFLRGSSLKAHPEFVALFSGLLFVAHPVQTMAVTYILQRCASLAAMFYMLSIVLYVRWRLGSSVRSLIGIDSNREFGVRRKITYSLFYALSLFSCVLAMKTKELAFTLPLVLALYEFLFFAPAHSQYAAGGIMSKRRALYLLPFLTTMLIIPYSYINMNIDAGEASAVLSGATTLEGATARLDYFLSQFGVIATYIRVLFLPIGQSMYYEDMVRHSFSAPGVFLPFLFLLGIFALGSFLFYRSRITHNALRLCAFGIFWFFLALSVESSVLPISDVINEYRVYLPSAGAFMAVVTGAFYLADRFGSKGRKAAVCAACAAVVALSGAAYARNTVWQSRTGLWEDTVRKAPGNPSGHFWLGKAYESEGLVEKAIEAYKDCIELKPDYIEAYNNLGVAYTARGMTDLAMEQYRSALEIEPFSPTLYTNLGNVYQARGMIDRAIEQYKLALKIDPAFAEAYNNLGASYFAKGMIEEAIEQYETALKLDHSLVEANVNLGQVYMKAGYIEKAEDKFRTALMLKSDSAALYSDIADAYLDAEEVDKAIEHYRAAAELDPRNPTIYYNLGIIYQSRGLLDNAIQLYRIALKVAPKYTAAYNNLGIAYQYKGMADKAIEHFKTALDLAPDNAQAHFNLGLIYFQKGLMEEAREEFEAALKINPDYDKARESLDRLDKKK